MSLHLDTLFGFRANSLSLIPYCCVLSGEATNTNFIVFGLTRPELEPTIYRTRGQHANHYTLMQTIFIAFCLYRKLVLQNKSIN